VSNTIGSKNRMRIGIWCAYGKTLSPSGGIGVFVHNLVRGLAGCDEVENIVLAVHAGEEAVVAETVAMGRGRIATAAIHRLPWAHRWRWRWHRSRQRTLCDRIARGDTSAALIRRRDYSERAIDQIFARQRLEEPNAVGPRDIWLLPHVGVQRPFEGPTVLVVHDMVPLRYSGVLRPKNLESFRRHCQRLVERSTLVATMSRTIRECDIVGLLGCPQEKVRVIPGAVPDDFGEPLGVTELFRRHPITQRRYLFYPAGYRSYKNHAVLIAALPLLHRMGHADLDLVFTGFEGLPMALAQQIKSAGVTGRVHALGVVDRPTLAGLYQQAAVTVVPSLYEQGSYPIVEAIHWGCPAACSDIPALREYLEPFQGTVPFFDARQPAELAAAVGVVLADRPGFMLRQQAALQGQATRSWVAVARDWLGVFAELAC
jgi:glycosyltransferase involved in cell wall biosynthesis